jgi:hypothetical protein
MLAPARCGSLAFMFIALVLVVIIAFDGPLQFVVLSLLMVAYALTGEQPRSAAPPRFRLEHRRPGRVRVLAATGRAALADQAAIPTAAGATGRLVLVDVTSGAAIT